MGKNSQLILIPLEEIEDRESSGNINRDRLGAGPEGKVCGDCRHLIDRGKPFQYWDDFRKRKIQLHSHKWRCVCGEGTNRSQAMKHRFLACAYFKPKREGD